MQGRVPQRAATRDLGPLVQIVPLGNATAGPEVGGDEENVDIAGLMA